jgi:hypothetical protein
MSALRSIAVVSVMLTAAVRGDRPLEAGPAPSLRYDRPLGPYDRHVVERVRAGAAARLEEPRCGRLLAEFRDDRGRTLQSNLADLGLSASEYLSRISFVDGASLPNCRRDAVAMATLRGARRVFVCPAGGAQVTSRLARMEKESGSLAEAAVIHEMLHTLGLGENPPTTFEITARVRDRCR